MDLTSLGLPVAHQRNMVGLVDPLRATQDENIGGHTLERERIARMASAFAPTVRADRGLTEITHLQIGNLPLIYGRFGEKCLSFSEEGSPSDGAAARAPGRNVVIERRLGVAV